jgi:hypothetical protein
MSEAIKPYSTAVAPEFSFPMCFRNVVKFMGTPVVTFLMTDKSPQEIKKRLIRDPDMENYPT